MKAGRLEAFALAIALAVGSGCATPRAEAMTVRSLDTAAGHTASVGVHVSGGGGLEFRISDEEFRGALEASLLEAGLFSEVVEIDGADFRLDAVLGDLRQQPAGFNMTSEITVLWNLSRVDTAETGSARTVWQELVTATHTATLGSSLIGVNRARIATERAARENIAEALRRLADAEL